MRTKRASAARASHSAMKLHLTLVAGWTLCGVAGWIEWRRALGGNTLSWAYAVEWPLFAVIGTWIWWRLLHEDVRPRSNRSRRRGVTAIQDDDPGLVAWRAYVAELREAEKDQAPPTAP